ncbi:predicted protein [Nematostella vectensis]|uniref:Choline transporter-like protein n=1 Tax=Nematostella vectensis TaxID=45351 RepID=A7RWE1_NEMVE|nr:predicted protein [Nematostella vectensis]|eukprot:XP_001636308.1 predicted protein [Nematostella vectensis]
MADEVDLGKKRSHDPEFKGPIEDRSCTDIICCLIFVAYIVGMVVVGIVAFAEGDINRLLLPTDSQGKVCGKDPAYLDKKYLVFFDITKCIPKGIPSLSNPKCYTPQVCVSKCPTKNEAGTSRDAADMICKPGVVPKDNLNDKLTLIKEGKCVPYYLASSPVLFRCVPSLVDLNSVFDSATNKNVSKSSVEQGIGGFVISMVLAFVYIIITRWIAGPLIWFTIIAVFALLVFGMYCCFSKYKELKDSGKSKTLEFTADLSKYGDSKETWLALGKYLSLLMEGLHGRGEPISKYDGIGWEPISKYDGIGEDEMKLNRIRIAVELIGEASNYLATNGVPQYKVSNLPDDPYNLTDGTTCDPATFDSKYPNTSSSCILVGYKENDHLLRMQVFHFFGWLWIMNFIIALGQCVLAGAFASWYFAFNKPDDVPMLPVLSSFSRTLKYHTGSLAFGAAIIAIVQFIRAVLEYIDRKLKESGHDNKAVKFIMCCCKCCFWCLEKCLRFLNKNAYIMIAIYGKNFCTSAKDAFQLLLRNILRVAAVNSVTSFLLFLGKVLVTSIVGVASYYWFRKIDADDPDSLNYDVVPVIISVVFAYVVTVMFFDVYDMCIDTIFLCFLEDLERNDGSAEKPYYMNDDLKKILNKQNRASTEQLDQEK